MMLTNYKYLFIGLIAIQIGVGSSYAGQDVGESCDTSADCNPGLWCEEYTSGTTPYKMCNECQNHPSIVSVCSKTETTSPGTCYYTDHGGTGANSCPWTMNCPDKPQFSNGTWAPDEPTITYSGTGDQPQCSYENTSNITCDEAGGTCNAGYHSNGNACVANAISDNCGSNSYKFYDTNSGEYTTQCLVSKNSCGNNSFGDSGFKCNGVKYGTCNATTKPCNEISVLVITCGNGNTVSGDAGIANNYPWTFPQYTNYSGCLCTKQNQALYSGGTQVGTADMSYKFNSSGNQLESNPTSVSVKTCIAGYYANNNQCTITQNGYYSADDETQQHKCPYGSTTTDTGSTSMCDCYFPTGTVFSDTNGNFPLPTNVSAKLSTTITGTCK